MDEQWCVFSGKARYRNRGEAARVMARLLAKAKSPRLRPMSVYRCGTCGDFHFGHKDYRPR